MGTSLQAWLAEHEQAEQARRASPSMGQQWQQTERFVSSIQVELEQRQHATQQAKVDAWAELRAEIDAATVERLQGAYSALEQARADEQSAYDALASHEQATPRGADVREWARHKGRLEDELDAYTRLSEQAAGAHSVALQRYQQALGQVWQQRVARARHEYQGLVESNKGRIAQALTAWQQAVADAEMTERDMGSRLVFLESMRE